MTDNKR